RGPGAVGCLEHSRNGDRFAGRRSERCTAPRWQLPAKRNGRHVSRPGRGGEWTETSLCLRYLRSRHQTRREAWSRCLRKPDKCHEGHAGPCSRQSGLPRFVPPAELATVDSPTLLGLLYQPNRRPQFKTELNEGRTQEGYMKYRASLLVLAAVVCLTIVTITVFAADNFTGTWKLNISMSQYNPGPPPRSLTSHVQIMGDTANFTFDGYDSSGK